MMPIIEEKHEILLTKSNENSEDEDDDNHEEHNILLIDGIKSNMSQNSSPLSIGKIKIFKPRRRNRFIRRHLTLLCISLCLLFIIVYLFNKNSLSVPINNHLNGEISCDNVITREVWNRTFPMLTIESALRLVDVNNDSVLDIIVPFGTGADAASYNTIVCQIYFNLSDTDDGCGGGIMAIDGNSGIPIWSRYMPHELFAINCNIDITGDNIKDCIAGGRMASLYAFDGATGEMIWSVPTLDDVISKTSNFYTPLYVPRDIDGDDVPEIIVMHGGDPLRKPNERSRIAGRLLIMSSKKGSILSWSLMPDSAESYYSPQLLTRPDGTLLILFGTGGETHPGSLYVISFDDLLQGKMRNAKLIYRDCCKGVMVPPVLVDINGDNISDIIMALFNSTVVAFDGLTFQVLWKREFIESETYSTPAVGFFNNDSIADFAVIYQSGPGFPIYYHSEFSILDGRNGNQLLERPIKMLIGTQSSPLTISTIASNDIFLFWFSSCETKNNTDNGDYSEIWKFKVSPGTNVHDTSRADFCKLRFNSTLYTQLRAVTPSSTSIIYDSRNHDDQMPYINYTAIGQQWLQQHYGSIDYYFNNFPSQPEQQYQQLSPTVQDYQSWKQQQSENPYPQYDRLASSYSYDTPYNSYNKRIRRHVGVHDGGGVQRVISTGTLAPPLSKQLNTIDLIFATFWIPPSKNVKLMTPEMDNCVSRYMNPEEESRLRLTENSIFKQLQYDHDAYEEAVKAMCLRETGQLPAKDPQQNPIIKEMGSMTLYRVNLKCESNDKKNVDIKEYNDQSWPCYMGRDGDCVAW